MASSLSALAAAYYASIFSLVLATPTTAATSAVVGSVTTAFVSKATLLPNNRHRSPSLITTRCFSSRSTNHLIGGRGRLTGRLTGLHSSPSDVTNDEDATATSSQTSVINSSFFDDDEAFQRDSRAGEDGYSVLRRPVTFDADIDPTFDAPRVLDEKEEELANDVNKLWYEERATAVLGDYAGPGQKSDGSNSNNKQQQHATRQMEEDQQLDMHQRTLDTLDYPLVLKALADECDSVFGKDLVQRSTQSSKSTTKEKEEKDDGEDALTMPLTASSVQGAHRRFGAVREMQRLVEGRVSGFVNPRRKNQSQPKNNNKKRNQNLLPLGAPPIRGYSLDLQPVLDILDEGKVLEGPEILDVTSMLELSLDVLDWRDALEEVNAEIEDQRMDDDSSNVDDEFSLRQEPFEELPKLASSIHVDDDLLHLLSNAFDEEGRLDGVTFPSVGRLRAKVRTFKRDILTSIDSLLSMPSMKSKLAVESGGALTMEINGRLVIPVQQKYQNSVGIVHDASRSGKTCYVEPTEIVGPTNELRQAEAELRSEEARVWRQLTETIVEHREEIEGNVASLGQLDVVIARVKLGKKLKGAVPEVGTEGVVSVKDARHPVLLLRGLEGVVGSDVDVGSGDNQGLILTGPNSGGKTIILKLLGLYALMARDGIPVPSKPNEPPPRVDFFSPILADIGDLQSVDGDLSTFSGHMLVCREVLTNAGKDALVLMDELGSGTDPNQGVAIARALLEALLDRGCRVAITTHYLELKQLASTDDRFAVAGMQFVGGRPTYKLMPGVIGESFALAVAERLKLPESVIQRANELLDTETRKMGELIRDLEDQKLLIDQKVEELAKRDFEMLELKAEMKEQQRKLEAKQLTARREEARKFAARLEEKEKLLEGILEKLKGGGASKKVVADSWSNIRIVKREAMSEAENVPGQRKQQMQGQLPGDVELIPISELKGITKLNVDDSVIVCKKGAFYGKEGIVKQVGKKIQVDVSGMPVRLTMKEIALPPSSNMGSEQQKAKNVVRGPKMSKMAQRALDLDSSANSPVDMKASSSPSPRDSGTTMKTKSNTVDCIGKNFEESKRKCIDAFSAAAMQNRSVVYVLHGHGTGVLKKKIRSWLQGDRQWVKSYRAADQADGGDAFTRVEMKKQSLF